MHSTCYHKHPYSLVGVDLRFPASKPSIKIRDATQKRNITSCCSDQSPIESTTTTSKQISIKATLARTIDDIGRDNWNACHDGSNPFLHYEFLNALEESKSVDPNTGWLPQHLVLSIDESPQQQTMACMPLYLKSHSYGEYVFDNSWAEAHDRYTTKRSYYPKLQAAVPFTPVSGNRLLIRPGPFEHEVRAAMAKTLSSIPEEMGVSSLHVTFNNNEEWELLSNHGFLKRAGIQYHWENGYNTQNEQFYSSFDDFLSTLQQKRRKGIRQERKKVLVESGLKICRYTGDDVKNQQLWDSFYEFYLNTIDRKWGVPYLTREFFTQVSETMPEKILLVVAYDDVLTTKPVAAALNFIGSDCLYGRNWGCSVDYKGLHFELCYYQALEFAIENRIARVEAGAQGEHKLQRGYLPALTYSSHFIVDEEFRLAVRNYLRSEVAEIAAYAEMLTVRASPYK